MATNFSPISPRKFSCDVCLITCNKATEWERHINTKKHKINKSGEISNKTSTKNVCVCGKSYKERSGLWRHKKSCESIIDNLENCSLKKTNNEDSDNNITFLTNLVLEVVKNNSELQKQNSELQKQVLNVCNKIQPTIMNNYNNSNNVIIIMI